MTRSIHVDEKEHGLLLEFLSECRISTKGSHLISTKGDQSVSAIGGHPISVKGGHFDAA